MRFFAPILLALVTAGCSGMRPDTEPPGTSEIVVATIGDSRITLDEFEQQYRRTLPDSTVVPEDSLAEYQDFLERYVDFRLKVSEAQQAGYDEREDLLTEMEQYRGQLARPYLLEREVVEPLIRDLWNKKQELVDVSHILFRLDEDATPADTLGAWNRLSGLLDSLSVGADFADLAFRYSEDPSAQTGDRPGFRGRLGYYSGGRMVKEFEDKMFATPVDSVSAIFRTQFGYHILKVHDRKSTMPERRLAHIMIQPRGQTSADSADASSRLQMVLDRIESGEDFADVASELSDDRQSSGRGGDLDFVAYDGWLPPTMRDAAFDLDGVGSVTAPVTTPFGNHVIKLLAERELPTFDEAYDDIKAEVSRLPRSDKAEQDYAAGIRTKEGSRVDSAWVSSLLEGVSADSVLFSITSGSMSDDDLARPIAFMGDRSFSAREFGAFAADYSGANRIPATERFYATLDAFLNDRAIALEVDRLEARDPQFRRTMGEFRDGLMLFRLMEDSVWTAAGADSAALSAFYDRDPASYRYTDRNRILGIATRNDSLIQVIHGLLGAGTPYGAILEAYQADSTSSIRFDTTFVSGETASIYDQAIALDPGLATDVLSYSGGRIILINDGIDPAREKTFAEARAEVAAAYQVVLEERLIARLRKENGVETFPERLNLAFKPR